MVVADEEEQGWGDWLVDTWRGNVEVLTESATSIIDAGSTGAAKVTDELGDDARDTAIASIIGGPVALASAGLLVAVALNPSILTNASKELKKIF
jgi:hypothetical protein